MTIQPAIESAYSQQFRVHMLLLFFLFFFFLVVAVFLNSPRNSANRRTRGVDWSERGGCHDAVVVLGPACPAMGTRKRITRQPSSYPYTNSQPFADQISETPTHVSLRYYRFTLCSGPLHLFSCSLSCPVLCRFSPFLLVTQRFKKNIFLLCCFLFSLVYIHCHSNCRYAQRKLELQKKLNLNIMTMYRTDRRAAAEDTGSIKINGNSIEVKELGRIKIKQERKRIEVLSLRKLGFYGINCYSFFKRNIAVYDHYIELLLVRFTVWNFYKITLMNNKAIFITEINFFLNKWESIFS